TVGCSQDAGATFLQFASAIDINHAFQISENSIGTLATDPTSHVVYQTYSAITTAAETACAPQLGVVAGTCNYHGVYMAVSTDGGATFTDYPVYINSDVKVGYKHEFVNISVNKAGNVYSVYTDDHHVYYSFSTDHGRTWSAPYLVSGSSGTQIFPWSTAGNAGKLDVVYYQTPYYGGVCESGVTCTGNRDLFDDFGVAASPTTGLASIVYSDDQYHPGSPNTAGCDASTSNSSSCDHTAIATQTGSSTIFGKK